tara:strand:+ start:646 stop:1815 length:1170 start_codon:yes stop_codon:yes gene_type:complete
MFTKNIHLIKNFLIIFLVYLIADIIIFYLVPTTVKDKLFVNRAHRIKSYYYHHDFRPKVSFYDRWGYERYKINTNNLGFKDSSKRNVKFKKTNILFIGDSFTEGVGLSFNDTYVGIISRKLKINNNEIEVLNAGVQSYSPKVYYAKLYDILYRKKYPITHIIVMISGGDVYDDFNKYGSISKKNILLHQDFQNLFILKFINFIKGNTFLYQLITRITPPKVISNLIASIFNEKDKVQTYTNYEEKLKKINYHEIMSFKFLTNPDYEYFYDDKKFNDWGKKGILNSSQYLKKISQITKEKNIKLDILYAKDAPLVLSKPIEKNLKFLLDTFKKETISGIGNFYYINEYSLGYSDSIEAYKNLFYIGDHHWNKIGNKKVADEIMKKVNFLN